MLRRSGSIRLDVCDVLDALDDDDLLDEVGRRNLMPGVDEDAMKQVREAHEELRRGRSAEALAILDRLLNPKWCSPQVCLSAYVKSQRKML